jgi:predicted transcriptional regulator
MPLFEQVLQEFTRRNLPYWAYHTSRGGNILFRLKEGEAANMGKCNFPGVQIWGNKHFCVLPPSVHASGVIYTWLMYTDPAINLPPLEPPPLLSLDQVDWLGVRPAYNERKEINLYGLPEWTCHISENNRKILASEIPDGERNLQLTKAVYDVAACVDDGIVDFSDAEKLLLASAERCIPPYSPKKIKGMLHSAMRKDGLKPAREYYPDVNLSSQRDDLPNKAKHFLENYDWHIFGRTAQTDRAVFTACVKRAELDRSEIFRASTREIADLANIQEPYTALKSLRRLQEKNIILRVDRQSSGAFQYKFGPEVTVPDHYTIPHLKNNVVMEHTPKTGECLPTTSVEQDIFLSLGRVSWFVWQHLKHSPERGATDIAKKRNLVRSSVSKSLNRLVKIGLVTYSTAEGIYFGEFFNTDALEELAERMGVLGKSDKRAQRFNRDREIRVNLQISKARSNFRNMRQTFQSGAKKEA